MAERIEREQVEEDARLMQEAADRALAEAEALEANSVYSRVGPYRDGPTPSPDELGIADAVNGLAPARSALVRLSAWHSQTRAELERLEAARERFLTDLGAPDITQRELNNLIARDKSGYLAWLKSGADQKTKPDIDSFRRQQVEAKLAAEGHAAEVARSALAELETEISVLRQGDVELAKRLPRAAQAVLVEEAGQKLAEYAAAADRLRILALDLAGLAKATPGQDFHRGYGLRQIDIPCPGFGDVRPKIAISTGDIDRAAEPWRAAERALIADPRTKFEGK